MKRLTITLLTLLVLGGCTTLGVSNKMTSNCFGCSYETLPEYKTFVKAFVSKGGRVFNQVDIYEPDYYRGIDY